MNTIEILEDCSPYYIKFKHRSITNILNLCSQIELNSIPYKSIEVINVPENIANQISLYLPYSEPYASTLKTMSLFVTGSKFYMRAHKDEPSVSTALNYTILHVDNKCETCWYDDLIGYKINYLNNGKIRDVVNFDKSKHTPSARLVSVVGEGFLINQEIFHDFDNSTSENIRTILHIKLVVPSLNFEDHKKILFTDNIVNS